MTVASLGVAQDADAAACNAGDVDGVASVTRSSAVAVAQAVDFSLDPTCRPLTGRDIVGFVHHRRLSRVQAVDALAMASAGTYAKLVKLENEPLPFELELLLRWYTAQPTRSVLTRPMEVFDNIYGELVQRFADGEERSAARLMLYERFAAMLGRTVFSAYRWFKINDSGTYGAASAPLKRLFALLPQDAAGMREALESLARETFRARGRDLDLEFPLPDPAHPTKPRRPGPVPGSRRRADPGSRTRGSRSARSDKAADA